METGEGSMDQCSGRYIGVAAYNLLPLENVAAIVDHYGHYSSLQSATNPLQVAIGCYGPAMERDWHLLCTIF